MAIGWCQSRSGRPGWLTFNYVKGVCTRRRAAILTKPSVPGKRETDDGATFDTVVTLRAEEIAPQVTRARIRAVISVTDMHPRPASL